MSKLSTIKETLQHNPDITVLIHASEPFIRNDPLWIQTYDFLVAPKKGLYSAAELQEFMLSLVPGLEPDSKDDFKQYVNSDRTLRFGALCFAETIGHVAITTDDPDFEPFAFFPNSYAHCHEQELCRRIMVYPFPNEEYARAIAKVPGGYLPVRADISSAPATSIEECRRRETAISEPVQSGYLGGIVEKITAKFRRR